MKKITLFIIIAIIILLCAISVSADFISSKTSKIFHELDCRYATNLNEDNSDTYSTYQEAIDDGLRGCNVCQPAPDPNEPEPDLDPEPDPNDINLFPKQPSIVIPINGMVLQMSHCGHEFNPETVGKPIIVKEEFSITLKKALERGLFPCLYYSAEENPLFPVIEPENGIDPNIYVVDEYGRSQNYWFSYFYNIMAVFNYNNFDPNEVMYLSARQMDLLENICAAFDGIKVLMEAGVIIETDYYTMYLTMYLSETEPYHMLKFLKEYIDQSIITQKAVYGTFVDFETYDIEDLNIYQQILKYTMSHIEEEYPDKINENNMSFPIDPQQKQNDPNSYEDIIVYTTYLSNFYHKENCNHFKGVELTMMNRETSVKAGNNATWYPESGIVTWRVTPFDIGDYIAIGGSNIGQTELLAVSVRPYRVPNLQDFTASWLKGNFNMSKYAEWLSMNGKILPATTNYDREISWMFEDGRWLPYGGRKDRLLVQKEHEIIDEITTKDRTTTTYERPLSKYSVVWEMTKKEVREITTTQYIREGDEQPVSSNINEWIFINGKWIVTNSQVNPYVNEPVYPSEEQILSAKPIAPTLPDPNAVDEEEERLKSLMVDPSASMLKPFIEAILASASKETYEEKLIQYGADYAEYEKNLKIWEEATTQIEEHKEMEKEEETMVEDREYRRMEEMSLMEEEQKISVIEELLIDERITDEQKGTLREILNAIREN